MGGVISSGRDNEDLVTNLLEAEYIKTEIVEKVFRAVDRADYFVEEARSNAYKDLAWKYGNLHISAPCIYSEVMEGLALKPGLSFLNLGSGTGYLSTLVGLILGPNGINHGIELHEDVVNYANERLVEFKKNSAALDTFEFCSPTFFQGNCLCLSLQFPQYDRVYCGAACPAGDVLYMKHLVKVGGILVMPLNDKLMQFIRTSQTNWTSHCLLSVSFASLVSTHENDLIKRLDFEPLSLQEMCRSSIRTILRTNIDVELPNLQKSLVRRPIKKLRKKREKMRRVGMPLFEEGDINFSDEDRYDITPPPLLPNGVENSPEFNKIMNLVRGITEYERELQMNSGSDADEDTENYSFKDFSSEMNIASDHDAASTTMNESNGESRPEEELRFIKHDIFDYGLARGMFADEGGSSDTEAASGMDVDLDSEDTASTCDRSFKRPQYVPSSLVCTGEKFKRCALSRQCLYNFDSDSDSDIHGGETSFSPGTHSVYTSPYTQPLRAKIQALPLPPMLKQYLNLNREF